MDGPQICNAEILNISLVEVTNVLVDAASSTDSRLALNISHKTWTRNVRLSKFDMLFDNSFGVAPQQKVLKQHR